METRESIAIIVDPHFGGRMRRLARTHFVWAVDSDTNRPVVEALWRTLPAKDLEGMVVTVVSPVSADPETMLDEAILHFPDVPRIAVYGTEAGGEDRWDCLMAERGFTPASTGEGQKAYIRPHMLTREENLPR